jgi:hypothetical protein
MLIQVGAVCQNGTPKPLQSLSLAENERFRVTITQEVNVAGASQSDAEFFEGLRHAGIASPGVGVHEQIVAAQMADDFGGGVPGNGLRSPIPIGDSALGVDEVDAIAEVFEDPPVETRLAGALLRPIVVLYCIGHSDFRLLSARNFQRLNSVPGTSARRRLIATRALIIQSPASWQAPPYCAGPAPAIHASVVEEAGAVQIKTKLSFGICSWKPIFRERSTETSGSSPRALSQGEIRMHTDPARFRRVIR